MSGNDDHGDGVLYGGPDVPLIESDCRSLGEVVLRKLAESKDNELVVSVHQHNVGAYSLLNYENIYNLHLPIEAHIVVLMMCH